MMNSRTLLLVWSLSSCFQPLVAQTRNPDDKALIKAMRTASNAAIARHAVDGIARYWLPDFVQVGGNGGYKTGKDSVAAGWQRAFRLHPDVVYVRSPQRIEVNPNGLLAWETGTWVGTWSQGGSFKGGGNYSAMWRKKDQGWQLQAELYVTLQ